MTAVAIPIQQRIARHTAVPAWVDALVGSCPVPAVATAGASAQLVVRESRGTCLASATLPEATALPTAELSHAVEAIYLAIARTFADRGSLHPVRFWNHIPSIHGNMGEGLDRYMAFNLGRYHAMRKWLGAEQAFATCMATASGIGCHGDTLVIHALASERAGMAIENPRQVPAYRYSVRYGPRPPCFARATAWTGNTDQPMLLIGGTASVRGEESMHVGNLAAQLEETCANIQALIANAATVARQPWSASSMRSLRAYLPEEHVADQVERAFSSAFPSVPHVELVSAQLCRKDLLVEVEGVAS